MQHTRARRLPADKRKRQIIESARGVFASQSYARVGTADLARAAGISEPALYRHFAGKKELFVATIRATGPRLLQIWEEISVDYEDPIETLWAIGVYYYDHLESHAANMKLQFRALSEADDPDIQAALHDNFEAFVDVRRRHARGGQGARHRPARRRHAAHRLAVPGHRHDAGPDAHARLQGRDGPRARRPLGPRVPRDRAPQRRRRPRYVNAEATPMRAPAGRRTADARKLTLT